MLGNRAISAPSNFLEQALDSAVAFHTSANAVNAAIEVCPASPRLFASPLLPSTPPSQLLKAASTPPPVRRTKSITSPPSASHPVLASAIACAISVASDVQHSPARLPTRRQLGPLLAFQNSPPAQSSSPFAFAAHHASPGSLLEKVHSLPTPKDMLRHVLHQTQDSLSLHDSGMLCHMLQRTASQSVPQPKPDDKEPIQASSAGSASSSADVSDDGSGPKPSSHPEQTPSTPTPTSTPTHTPPSKLGVSTLMPATDLPATNALLSKSRSAFDKSQLKRRYQSPAQAVNPHVTPPSAGFASDLPTASPSIPFPSPQRNGMSYTQAHAKHSKGNVVRAPAPPDNSYRLRAVSASPSRPGPHTEANSASPWAVSNSPSPRAVPASPRAAAPSPRAITPSPRAATPSPSAVTPSLGAVSASPSQHVPFPKPSMSVLNSNGEHNGIRYSPYSPLEQVSRMLQQNSPSERVHLDSYSYLPSQISGVVGGISQGLAAGHVPRFPTTDSHKSSSQAERQVRTHAPQHSTVQQGSLSRAPPSSPRAAANRPVVSEQPKHYAKLRSLPQDSTIRAAPNSPRPHFQSSPSAGQSKARAVDGFNKDGRQRDGIKPDSKVSLLAGHLVPMAPLDSFECRLTLPHGTRSHKRPRLEDRLKERTLMHTEQRQKLPRPNLQANLDVLP